MSEGVAKRGMPYLDWSRTVRTLEVESHPQLKNQIQLSLNADESLALVANLIEVFGPEGGELRLKVSENWVLFWKRRESENRVLLAHPDVNAWVGTIALDAESGKRLFSALQTLAEGQSLVLSEWVSLAKMSNLELIIRRE